jgi:NAD(P)-dependent dehydrogenase (short-subunit alcohol dehydrogenase family)
VAWSVPYFGPDEGNHASIGAATARVFAAEGARAVFADMRDGGSMIFNSSVVGLMSDATIAGYATSKHAIVGLYAYLAAHRVDRLLGAGVRWQPIAFAFLLRATGRTPWSFTEARVAGMRECEERAAR